MRKILIILSVFIICILETSTGYSVAPERIVWQHYTSMPAQRSNVVLIKRKNLVYVSGGNDSHGATASFWAFNTRTGKWKTLASMKQPRYAHSAVIYGNALYVFGGINGTNKNKHFVDSVEKYDFAGKRWSTVGRMPVPNAYFGLAEYDGKIYMAGGVNSKHSALKNVFTYDPDNNSWQEKKSLPIGRSRLKLINFQDHLYLLGGGDSKGNALGTMLRYNPNTDTWNGVAKLNEPRKNFGWAIYHHNLLVAGGWRTQNKQPVFIGTTELYNPTQNEWEVVGKLPLSRDGVRMIASTAGILLFGGYHKDPTDNVLLGVLSVPTLKDQITTVNHVCLVVEDMKKTLNFYRNLSGFKMIHDRTEQSPVISEELGLENVLVRNVMLETPNHFRLEFLQFYRPEATKSVTHKMNKIAYNHIGIGVKDIDSTYKILKQHHIKTISSPAIKKSTGYAIFFAMDPDGNYIEFFQKLT